MYDELINDDNITIHPNLFEMTQMEIIEAARKGDQFIIPLSDCRVIASNNPAFVLQKYEENMKKV